MKKQYRSRKVIMHKLHGSLAYIPSGHHRITESQNSRGWKGPLWVI